jgi:hypothetical protein
MPSLTEEPVVKRETYYTTILPRYAKVLACRFVTSHGILNGLIARWLAAGFQSLHDNLCWLEVYFAIDQQTDSPSDI